MQKKTLKHHPPFPFRPPPTPKKPQASCATSPNWSRGAWPTSWWRSTTGRPTRHATSPTSCTRCSRSIRTSAPPPPNVCAIRGSANRRPSDVCASVCLTVVSVCPAVCVYMRVWVLSIVDGWCLVCVLCTLYFRLFQSTTSRYLFCCCSFWSRFSCWMMSLCQPKIYMLYYIKW